MTEKMKSLLKWALAQSYVALRAKTQLETRAASRELVALEEALSPEDLVKATRDYTRGAFREQLVLATAAGKSEAWQAIVEEIIEGIDTDGREVKEEYEYD